MQHTTGCIYTYYGAFCVIGRRISRWLQDVYKESVVGCGPESMKNGPQGLVTVIGVVNKESLSKDRSRRN